MIEIEEKHRIYLEALNTQVQGYIDTKGLPYISAVPFIQKIGDLSFTMATQVAAHYRVRNLFARIEIKEVEVPLLPLWSMGYINNICIRIEQRKRKELSKNKRRAVNKEDYVVDRDRAEKAFLQAAGQMRELSKELS